jgi:hypothetical protein
METGSETALGSEFMYLIRVNPRLSVVLKILCGLGGLCVRLIPRVQIECDVAHG